MPLISDSLLSLDSDGKPKAGLATAWESSSNRQRWQFNLRSGITFSDGTALTSETVAACLRKANLNWTVIAGADQIVIESASASPNLLAELTLPRNRIVKRDGSKLIGSGPFIASQWDAGRKLILVARDGYWGGRPFLDSIELSFGKNFREQMMAFDLGQAQLIELAPEQTHQAATATRKVQTSAPDDLLALVFAKPPQSPEEITLRTALSLSINRDVLNSVVLQGGGVPTGSILPNWMTGYGFVFPSDQDLTRAQQLRGQVQQSPLWTLGFEVNDPVARVIAERIVLNARDAGLRLQLGQNGDVQLVKVPLGSREPRTALMGMAATLGITPPTSAGDTETDLYHAEHSFLSSGRVVPLLHLRRAYAVSINVRGWKASQDGSWDLSNIWLAEKP